MDMVEITNILLMDKNPAPVDSSLSYYLQGFLHPRWLFGISSINRWIPGITFQDVWEDLPLKLHHGGDFPSPNGTGMFTDPCMA